MKKYSLERLVDLARKTGGKLIVHNELFDNEDVVILSVEEFEKMADGQREEYDVRDLSSDEMLDQINRDIAVWRANKEQEEQWENDTMSDEEVEGESFDPFSGHDFHSTECFEETPKPKMEDKPKRPGNWHSVSDVLDKKYISGEDPSTSSGQEEIKIENVPFKPMGADVAWQEEPLLSDEPVFYEEPV